MGCPDFRLVFTLKIADVLEFSLGTKVRAYGPSSELRETECSRLHCVLAEDVTPNPRYLWNRVSADGTKLKSYWSHTGVEWAINPMTAVFIRERREIWTQRQEGT